MNNTLRTETEMTDDTMTGYRNKYCTLVNFLIPVVFNL